MVCICFLATLYHVSVPVRTNWSFNLPGAMFSLVAWIVGSYVLRWVLTATAADSRSIYGPLAAPIAVLLWLYLVAIAVLIGAAVNAAVRHRLPAEGDDQRPPRAGQRLRTRMSKDRARCRSRVTPPRRLDSPVPDDPSDLPGRTAAGRAARRPCAVAVVGARPPAAAALAILVGTVLLVYFDRDGYRDANDPTGDGRAWSTRSTTRPSR